MTAKLTVTYDGAGTLPGLRLKDENGAFHQLTLTGGKATIDVSTGVNVFLIWAVVGPAGTPYTMTLSTEAGSKVEAARNPIKRTLPQNEFGFGREQVRIVKQPTGGCAMKRHFAVSATLTCVAVLVGSNLLFAQAGSQATTIPQNGLSAAVKRYLAQDWTAAQSETFTAHQDPIIVEAGQTNGKATITLKPQSDCMLDAACWNVQLSAPIDKASGIGDFTNLDKLAKDFKVTFERRWRPGLDKAALDDFAADVDRLCTALGLTVSCDEESVEAELKKKTDTEIAALKDIQSFTAKARQAVTVAGSMSYNTYKFFEVDGTKADTDEYGFGLRVAYSAPLANTGFRWAASVAGERAYSDGETRATLCKGIAGSLLETCETRPLGEPLESESIIFRAELRRLIRKFVISPMVAYDSDTKIWGAELPFYFLRGSKGELTGGFRIGWRSDQDVTASIFVSKPLNFSLGPEE